MKELLREVVEEDLDLILRWRNVPEVRQNMYTNHVISASEHANWWKRMHADERVRLLILEVEGEPLGFVSFTNYTGLGGSATWAFYTGNSSRRGIGSIMERAALEYAFDVLQLHRLECEVLGFNKAVIDFHVKHGFEVEGIFRDAYERQGEMFSIFRLALLKQKWTKYVRPMLSENEGVRSTLAGLALKWTDVITPTVVDGYSSVTGDDNPIHLDDAEARRLGFERRIVHGMLIGGLLSRYFANEFPGRGTIYLAQNLEFKAPVFVGDAVENELRVKWHIGKKVGVSTLSKVDEKICVEGDAVLMLPPGNWRKEDFQ